MLELLDLVTTGVRVGRTEREAVTVPVFVRVTRAEGDLGGLGEGVGTGEHAGDTLPVQAQLPSATLLTSDALTPPEPSAHAKA